MNHPERFDELRADVVERNVPAAAGHSPRSQLRKTCVELRDGDRQLLFSDGFPEATVAGEPLGYERIEEIAAYGDDLLERVRAILGVVIDHDATAVIISPA